MNIKSNKQVSRPLAIGYKDGELPDYGVLDINKIKTQQPSVVFLIGAGASKDIGMPLVNDLLSKEYYETLLVQNSSVSLTILNKYANSNLSFEELLVKCYNENYEEYEQLILHYEHLLYSAESKAGLSELEFDEWLLDSGYHVLFGSFLKSFTLPVTVISFNHDNLIELGTANQGFNYGTQSNTMYALYKIPGLPEFGYDFTLLKLHGSFSYLLCDNCKNVACGSDYAWFNNGMTCLSCKNGSLNPAYVPPLKGKDTELFPLMWDDARYCLERATVLFIIGYSMPKYDEKSQILLKNYLNPRATVFIIDKFASHVAHNYSFLKQNKKYFRSIAFKDFLLEIYNERGNLSFTDFIWFR